MLNYLEGDAARMRAFGALLLLLTVLLAGCASNGGGGGGDDEPSATSSATRTASGTRSGSGTATASATGTGTTAPQANQPPAGGVSTVVNGTSVAFNLTGTDPDGDALSWTLSFGDGNETAGTVLPAAVNHTYAAGNHTAQYTLTDGKSTAVYNVTLNVTGSSGSGPIQTVKGTWPLGAFGCGAEYDPFPAELREASGTGFFSIDVAPATIGRTYTMVMTWDATPAALGGDIAFYAADGAYVEGNLITGSSPLTFTGPVPAGAAFAIASVCDVVGAEIVYTA